MAHECERCGVHVENRFTEDTARGLEERRRCLDCGFWENYERRRDDSGMVRIDGQHYVIAGELRPGDCGPGFGGREFRIRFHDGRKVVTRNLWHQGEIPERFRTTLPDNASFVTRKRKGDTVGADLPDVIVNQRAAGIRDALRTETSAGFTIQKEKSR